MQDEKFNSTEMKVNVDSKEYQDFEKALDIVNQQIMKVNDSITRSTDNSEMNALGAILKGLLADRDSICQEDRETIERILKSKA